MAGRGYSMYKESIDRENRKLKDELRVLKAAMKNISSDTPISATTRDPLRLPTPKSSFSTHIPGLKSLIEAAKPTAETERRSRPNDSTSHPRSLSQDRDTSSEADAIKAEVEQELASLREKLDSMKTQHTLKKPPLSPLPLPSTYKADMSIQTYPLQSVTVSVQTDGARTGEVAVQTNRESEELVSIEVGPGDVGEEELRAEFDLLRDENAALRTLLSRKEQRESHDSDSIPTKEKPGKKGGKANKPKCDFCNYLQAHNLPLSTCRRHRR